jgi:hypothetical protein
VHSGGDRGAFVLRLPSSTSEHHIFLNLSETHVLYLFAYDLCRNEYYVLQIDQDGRFCRPQTIWPKLKLRQSFSTDGFFLDSGWPFYFLELQGDMAKQGEVKK